MNRIKFITHVLVFILLIVSICACQTDIGRTARTAYDDTAIAAVIMKKFYQDPVINMFDISVVSSHGVVKLEGKVDTEQTRGRAERIALTVNGVVKVNNLITIR